MKKNIYIAVLAVALLLIVPLLPLKSSWLTTLSYIGIYALPALGIVILTGVAGMLSFGQAAFMGVGAYASAVLSSQYGLSPWLGLVGGWIATAAAAWVLGIVTLPMSGHYLPIATLAWGFALNMAFANLDVLGRNDGLSGLPGLSLAGISLQSPTAMYYVIWTVVVIALLLCRNLLDSRPGRAVRSLIGGKTMPESMGVNTVAARRTAFLIAALLASTSGWLYTHFVRAVSPSAFSPHYSLEFVFMAVIGGASSIWGALLGSAIVVVAKDLLQTYLPKLLPVSGNFESVLFGLALVVLLIRTREGIWPFLRRKLQERGWNTSSPFDLAHHVAEQATPAGGTLEVAGVTKRFGGLLAVNDVSFTVQPAEVVALIGPNGAGKSTTFNLITGVLEATSGSVTYAGKDLTGAGSREIAGYGVLRTFQHVRLIPDMTVLENIAIGAHLPGEGNVWQSALRLDRKIEADLLRRCANQAERVGLGAHLYDRAGSLSLGQQRMVEIARALAGNPSLLLLDEPAAGLRYAEKIAFSDVLRQLRSQGMAILLVEHDMQFVMDLADRIVVLDFGTCIARGLPAEIQSNADVQRAYLGVE